MKRRTTYAVLAWLLGVLGVLALVAGSVLGAAFGQKGQMRSAASALSGPGAAIVLEQLQVDATSIPVPDGVGTLTIDVDPVGPRAVFVGTAAPADLDGYLRAVPYDVVTALEPGGQAKIRSVPGSALPGPPQNAPIWKQQQTGAPGQAVSLQADLSGDPSLVVMNAVPAAGVEADVVVTLTIAWAWTAAVCLVAGGLLAVVLCVLLAWRSHVAGRRARADRTAAAAHRRSEQGPTTAATVLPAAATDDPTQVLPALADGQVSAPGVPSEQPGAASQEGVTADRDS